MKYNIEMIHVPVDQLKAAAYNPRKWDEKAVKDLTESIKRFGLVDPIIVNKAPAREGIIIGGHFRWHVAKELGYTEVPVVYVDIADLNKEVELNIRLNKNTGDFDWNLLANLDNEVLLDSGFTMDEMNVGFGLDLGDDDDEKDKSTPSGKEVFKLEFPKSVYDRIVEQFKQAQTLLGVETNEEVLERLLNDLCQE